MLMAAYDAPVDHRGHHPANHRTDFLAAAREARTRAAAKKPMDPNDTAAWTMALEDACTTLCLGGEGFIRAVDVDATFDELSSIILTAELHADVLVLGFRTLASVVDLVPRAAHLSVLHPVFEHAMKTAHSVVQLQACEPLADEVLRVTSILATEVREAMLKRGALPLFATYLGMLGERYHLRIMQTIAHLCGGLGPDALASGIAVDILLSLVTVAEPAVAGSAVVLTPKTADVLMWTFTAFGQLIDRVCISERDATELLQKTGARILPLLARTIAVGDRSGEHGPKVSAAALGAVVELHLAAPRAAASEFANQGVIAVLASRLMDAAATGPLKAHGDGSWLKPSAESRAARRVRAPNPHDNGDETNVQLQALTAIDALFVILPPSEGSDGKLVSLPKHRWSWEDDFRNHNAFDDANAALIENEYQFQRRGRRFQPVVIMHSHRLTTLHLQQMRQGHSIAASRPIFRGALPAAIVHRHATVQCSCSLEPEGGVADASVDPSDGQRLATETTDGVSEREDGHSGNNRRRRGGDEDRGSSNSDQDGDGPGCCERFCGGGGGGGGDGGSSADEGSRAQRSPTTERTHHGSSSRGSGRRGRKRTTTARSTDVRETQQLSPDHRQWIATQQRTMAGYLSNLLPAVLAVLRSTVDSALVWSALVILRRLLHAVAIGSPNSDAHSIVLGLAEQLAAALTVTLRAAAARAVDADRAASMHQQGIRAEESQRAASARARGYHDGLLMGRYGFGAAAKEPMLPAVLPTRRACIIEHSCAGIASLAQIAGAENMVGVVRRAQLDMSIGALVDHLEIISSSSTSSSTGMPLADIGAVPSPNHPDGSASLRPPDDGVIHDNDGIVALVADSTTEKNNTAAAAGRACPVHTTAARQAAVLLQSVAAVAELLGSAASSPTMPADTASLFEAVMCAAAVLGDAESPWPARLAQVRAINALCRDSPPAIGAFADICPELLPALATCLELVGLRRTAQGGVTAPHDGDGLGLDDVAALRGYLWSKTDALISTSESAPLLDQIPLPLPAAANLNDDSYASRRTAAARPTTSLQTYLSTSAESPADAGVSQLRERMGRALILKLDPVAPSALPENLLEYVVPTAHDVHLTLSPLAPLWHLCRSARQRLAAFAKAEHQAPPANGNGAAVADPRRARSPPPPLPQGSEGVAADGNSDFNDCVVLLVMPADTPATTPTTAGTARDGVASSAAVSASPRVVVAPLTGLAVVDALFYYHPSGATLRNFVTVAASSTHATSKPGEGFKEAIEAAAAAAASLWRGVTPVEFALVRREALQHLVPPSTPLAPSIAVGCGVGGACCGNRAFGHPACTPIHAVADATADRSHDAVATLRALAALEGIVASNASGVVEAVRLGSAVTAAIRRVAPSFQVRLFAHISVTPREAPLLGMPPPRTELAASALSGGAPAGSVGDQQPQRTPLHSPTGAAVGRSFDGIPSNSSGHYLAASVRTTLSSARDGASSATGVGLAALLHAPGILPLDLRVAILRDLCVVGSVGALPGENAITKVRVVVEREHLIAKARSVLAAHPQPMTMLDVSFEGEAGTGPGPTSEFYASYASSFRSSSSSSPAGGEEDGAGLWATLDSDTYLYPHPRFAAPGRARRCEGTESFTHLGRLIARCLVEGRSVDLPLHPLLWQRIAAGDASSITTASTSPPHQREAHALELATLDAGLARSLAQIEACITAAEFDALCLSWAVPGFETIAARGDDPDTAVDFNDRFAYADAIRRFWLLDVPRSFASACADGMRDVFSPVVLRLFTPAELSRLLSGPLGKLWDSPDRFLAAVACDHGYRADSEPVRLLADVVAAMNAREQRQFLRFVSGKDAMPAEGLTPKLTIVRRDVDPEAEEAAPAVDGAGDTAAPALPGAVASSAAWETPPRLRQPQDRIDASLPTVNTCFHYLKLPQYSSRAVLEERFKYALSEGQGCFLLS